MRLLCFRRRGAPSRRKPMLAGRIRVRPLLALSLLFAVCFIAAPSACRDVYAQTTPTVLSSANAPASAPQLKADLRRILSSEEFRPESKSKNSLAKLVQDLRERWERLRKWFGNLFHASGLNGGGTALTWTLVILMVCVLLWVAYRLLRDWTPRCKSAPGLNSLRALEEAAPADIVRDPEHWRREAEKHAQAGEYRAAYRALFLAVLLLLDQAGILAYHRARANGDYIRALRSGVQSDLYETLLPPTECFDRFWYGHTPAQSSDYQTLLGIYQNLPALLSSTRAARSAATSNTAAAEAQTESAELAPSSAQTGRTRPT